MRGKAAAGIVAGILLLIPAAATPGQDFGERNTTGCPGPYCRYYSLLRCSPGPYGARRPPLCGAPISSDGLAHIPFWVNPRNLHGFPADVFVRAVLYAARTWELADPIIRFEYRGLTDATPTVLWPGVIYDGLNVVGFSMDPAVPYAAAATAGSAAYEWDIAINLWHPPTWLPCRTACRPVPADDVSAGGVGVLHKLEIGKLLVHELGHVLGLDDVSDTIARCVTMYYTPCYPNREDYPTTEERALQSPSLAEYLGVKRVYPYTCPKPPKGRRINPGDRSWLPWRYRVVCPTIMVSVP